MTGKRMRRTLGVSGALFGLALAQHSHARADAVAPWNWSSCYIGGNLGWNGARSAQSATTPSYTDLDQDNRLSGFAGGVAPGESQSSNSIALGGQAGCRYQTPQRLVFGMEADFDALNGRQTRTLGASNIRAPFLAGDTFSLHDRWESSLTGSVGYAWDRWLAYVTGGVAVAKVRWSADYLAGNGGGPVTFVAGSGTDSKTLTGVTIGFGGAYAIDGHWSIGAEYRYTNYGIQTYKLGTILSNSANADTLVDAAVTGRADLQTHELLAKLNYSFGWFNSDTADQSLYMTAAPSASAPRLYGGAEYLLWQVKGAPLSVPLVSTGPIATTHHGLLGPPENGFDSTILYGASQSPASGGNDNQNFDPFSGARLTLGYWLDDAERVAIEASAFDLQKRTAGYSARGDTSGNPVLGIPVYNSVAYLVSSQTIYPGEDSLPFSLPDDPNRARANGVIIGGTNITNSLTLWGTDVSGVFNIHRGATWELSGVAGFRYLQLAEAFKMTTDITGISGAYTGESGVVWDQFQTRNQFFGSVLGLRGRYMLGPWSLEMTPSVGIGLSRETISIAGGYTATNFGATSGPEGVFAQPSNEGTYSGNRFAFVPEIQAKLGFDLTPSVRLTIGYDALYYSNVVRPTDQINREIPKGQTFEQSVDNGNSSTSPYRLFKTTDFYAQGLSAGVSARF